MDREDWFVLRDLKRHNAKDPAWRVLPEKGFNTFTPMHESLRVVKGRTVRMRVPVIPDLLFVKATKHDLDEHMVGTPTLQYRYMKGAPYRSPMTVPNAEMERFIHAVRSVSNPVYYLPEDITPDMIGKRVRIVDGPMSGYEGKLMKVRGSRKRKLLISLENYIVAAIEVEKDFIEFL